jgi:hypothetical protein
MESEWNRGDVEMAMALKRAELNRALAYKTRYDADRHNLCLALVRFKDGTFDVLAAYSNDSAIPESLRLGLGLVPDLYASMPKAQRFGCDGRAQYHTEPKLLNYLCASPSLRLSRYCAALPRNAVYRAILAEQRGRAAMQSAQLKQPQEIASVTLVTEIACCRTCTQYSVDRFRSRFPHTRLTVIELGKRVVDGVPPQFDELKVSLKR